MPSATRRNSPSFSWLLSNLGLNRLIQVDTKFQRLRISINTLLKDNPKDKIIIFSSFRATLEYLAERLHAEGLLCIQLHGGRRERKDDIIAKFRDHQGPIILLSSEVGSEGIDLQFSRVIINYDLPWNPMVIEQRIGRIDRLGQDAPKVLIWNLLYADTLDAYIYKRLYEKLDLCRIALGDFERILGDAVRKLTIDLLSVHLTEEQQKQRIDQTAQALANLRIEEQQLEQQAAGLIAHGDYILSQIHSARDLNRWITGRDLQHYVIDHLNVCYPGCMFHQVDAMGLVFDIQLPDKARFDLEDFIRTQRLPATRLSSASGRPIRCRFDNRAVVNAPRGEEMISQFHSLVRMVSHQIDAGDQQITPAVAVVLGADAIDFRISPATYVLAVMLWSCHALQDNERLAYAAATVDDPETLIEPELAERLAIAAIQSGQDWLEARNLVDLEHIHHIADNVLFARLAIDLEQFTMELTARNEDRADFQLNTLNQHLQRQTAKLQALLEKHRSSDHPSLTRLTEGRIQAVTNRMVQRRLRIETRRRVVTDSREIAVAIVRVS